jgi:glycosyltransferase involved in cell wall biosynthesis
MKILVVHNHYRQPGGEDTTVEQEIALLRDAGHQVVTYHRSNCEADSFSALKKLTLPARFVRAGDAVRDLHRLIQQERPDIAHFHNTHFMISPAAYAACCDMGVPVVQTLQNYRLFCPNALFFRDGRICEDCIGKMLAWPGIVHACYRASRAQSAMVAATMAVHRWLHTWRDRIAIYVAPTAFVRQKLVQGGLSADKIAVKPNFVYPDPGSAPSPGDGALFVGRLSPEKGVRTLLAAWERLAGKIPLKIVGDGPQETKVASAAQRLSGVEWLGRQPMDRVLALMKNASILIFPSTWYEVFPLVIVEAYATGLPVIASDIGSMSSLIAPNRTGLHFRPGDPADLADKVARLLSNPAELARMRREARAEFEASYTAEQNYRLLMDIYEAAQATYATAR